MSEQPEVETFVRKEPDGTEQVRHFAPWPTGPGGQPQMQMRVVLVQVPEGDGGDSELRHLSYDDPPGTARCWPARSPTPRTRASSPRC
jgi:hypothetical protein